MPNILDYIDWRGDLTFEQSAFNEVDNLIISEMCYVDFDGIVPGISEMNSISVWEASRKFFNFNSMENLKKEISFKKDSAIVLRKMAECRRYKNLKLSNYINRIEYENEFQFSAMVITLDSVTNFVAYRGTDSTIIGWKEDFNMSFQTPVPSQQKAVDYLNIIADKYEGCIIAGGHSKGGNLAVYAAIYSSEKIQNRLVKIYNNDGPGFPDQIIQTEEYNKVADKIVTLIPQNSIVGILLEHGRESLIVKSKKMGIVQHDMMTWEVMRDRIVLVDELAKSSQILDATLKTWISGLDLEQRKIFINTLFLIIEGTGAKTLEDLTSSRLKNAIAIFKTIASLDAETKEVVSKTLKLLFRSYNNGNNKIEEKI